ncbi:hypothetical protein DCPSUM001_24820 [Dysgonomonas capnocytophagoides]|nr:hypothetical protein DCPSUM001_24820 [Dysgonomonas capnocytophagoides]
MPKKGMDVSIDTPSVPSNNILALLNKDWNIAIAKLSFRKRAIELLVRG